MSSNRYPPKRIGRRRTKHRTRLNLLGLQSPPSTLPPKYQKRTQSVLQVTHSNRYMGDSVIAQSVSSVGFSLRIISEGGSRAWSAQDACLHMQAKATAKYKKQQRTDADGIGQEEQAASSAQSQNSLQNLFKRWHSNMEQASSMFIHTPQAVCRAHIWNFQQVMTGMQHASSSAGQAWRTSQGRGKRIGLSRGGPCPMLIMHELLLPCKA